MKVHEETIVRAETVAFVSRRFAGSSFGHPFHRHPEIELTWILDSSGTRIVGDHMGVFRPGDLCLLGSQLPHIYREAPRSGGRSVSEVLHFHPNFANSVMETVPELSGLRSLIGRSARGIAFGPTTAGKAGPLLIRLRNSGGVRRWRLFFQLFEILLEADDHSTLASAGYGGVAETPGSTKIRRICQYILDHFDEPLSHSELARMAGASPGYFSRLFKSCTRKTFQQFVAEVRLGRASQLLLETDLAIIDIAYASGFRNLSNFNRSFLQFHGTSPREFRKVAHR